MIEIKKDIEPHLDYVVEQISDMGMFDKARAKLLLLFAFSDIIQSVYNKKSELLAGEATNNQREIQYGSSASRDKHFLQQQNTIIKEKTKELNRTSAMAKNLKEHYQLREYLKAKFGNVEFVKMMNDSLLVELDLSAERKSQGLKK